MSPPAPASAPSAASVPPSADTEDVQLLEAYPITLLPERERMAMASAPEEPDTPVLQQYGHKETRIHRMRKGGDRLGEQLVRNIGHVNIRWLFDVACGRRRSNYFTPLVFLVPISVCFSIFMWPTLLPTDLVQAGGVMRATTRPTLNILLLCTIILHASE